MSIPEVDAQSTYAYEIMFVLHCWLLLFVSLDMWSVYSRSMLIVSHTTELFPTPADPEIKMGAGEAYVAHSSVFASE